MSLAAPHDLVVELHPHWRQQPPRRPNLQLVIVHENSTSVYTYTWPATVKWAGATPFVTSNTANAVDVISFFWDGTSYFAIGNAGFA